MTTFVESIQTHSSFQSWSAHCREVGLDPLIYIVGTRGKSTIVRLLDAMAKAEGLRTAIRTNAGVEIEGKRQLGDVHPLRDSLEELDAGELDLVMVEMGWGDMRSLPLNGRKPAAVVVATICPNKDFCLLEDTRRAIAGLKALLLLTPAETRIAVDLDDAAFPFLTDLSLENLIVTTAGSENPILEQHLAMGGTAAWSRDESLVIGTQSETYLSIRMHDVPITLNGAALFQIRNVLMAAATAQAIGLSTDAISAGAAAVLPDNAHLPTSMNAIQINDVRIWIDRPSPPLFLSAVLRAIRALKPGRVFFVLDYRDVANQDETVEVGRMIGRQAAQCIVINEHASLASVVALKAGIAQNEVTPPIVHTESLARAVLRALGSARSDDLVVVLTNRPQTVYRTLARQDIESV